MSEQDVTKEQQEQEELVRAVYPYARRLMLEQNMDTRGRELLMEKGLTEESAKQLVEHLRQERQTYNQNRATNEYDEEAIRNMAIGGIICVIGLVVSIVSYQTAANSPGGGRYVLAWGAVIFGGFRFLNGLFNYID